MNEGQWWIKTRSQESRDLFERVKVATRLSSKLSAYSVDEGEEIREAFEELIGKPVGDSFTLIPPFYADHGLNITVGRAVFIGYECMFTGHAAIDIADQVMIANKVHLVTSGHPVEPGRQGSDTRPWDRIVRTLATDQESRSSGHRAGSSIAA